MRFFRLLKHEFLEDWAVISLVNGILLLLALLCRATFSSTFGGGFAALLGLLPLFVLCAIIFLAITIIKSLHARLFTPLGYLTFSLPLNLDAILSAKILVASAWAVLSALVVILLSFIVLGLGFNQGVFGAFSVLREADLGGVFLLVATLFLNTIKIISAILCILALLNSGKIVRFKPLCGIVIFFLFSLFEGVVLAIFGAILGRDNATLNSVFIADFAGLLSCAVVIFIYYFLARFLIQNKLEI